MADNMPVLQLITVVERGFGKRAMELYDACGVKLHYSSAGRGSASSQTLERLGIGSSEKDIVFSYAAKPVMDALIYALGGALGRNFGCRGIAILQELTALNRLVAMAMESETEKCLKNGGIHMEKDRTVTNSLIIVTVDQGYTDDVMDCARKHGANGGTILRTRFVGAEQLEQFHGIMLQEEKEMLLLVVDGEKRNEIMEAVNARFGMKTEAHAMLCALPVERAFLLS